MAGYRPYKRSTKPRTTREPRVAEHLQLRAAWLQAQLQALFASDASLSETSPEYFGKVAELCVRARIGVELRRNGPADGDIEALIHLDDWPYETSQDEIIKRELQGQPVSSPTAGE